MSFGRLRDQNQTIYSSGTPHFFNIILEETLQENKLRIPQKFTRKYGETLSNSVFVKLPCGSKWKMKLARQDNKIWLERGWPDFSKHYSLKRGNMLMFRYEGNSEFHAVIFDTSTVEIDYPSIPLHFDNYDVDLRLTEDDSIGILDNFSPCPKAREKSPLPCSQPHKRMRASPTQSNLSGPNEYVLDSSISKRNFQSSKPEIIGKPDLPAETDRDKSSTRRKRVYQIVTSIKTPMDRSRNVAALQKASDFKSKRPFFKVVMQPSYVNGYHLNFPSDFARSHLTNKSDHAILIVSNGRRRTWSVVYKLLECKNKLTARFQSGWSSFVGDSNLEVGDVCVFVLLEGIKIAFEVVIFRVNSNSKYPISTAHEGGKILVEPEEILTSKTQSSSTINYETGKPGSLDHFPATQATGCISTPWKTSQRPLTSIEKVPFESENPFFKVLMQPTYVGPNANHLRYVPLDFATGYIKNEGDVVLLVPSGNYWCAQFKTSPLSCSNRSARLCNGWQEFASGNNLEVGDVCIFELLDVDGNEILFKVSIVCLVESACLQQCQGVDYAASASKPKGEVRVKIEID